MQTFTFSCLYRSISIICCHFNPAALAKRKNRTNIIKWSIRGEGLKHRERVTFRVKGTKHAVFPISYNIENGTFKYVCNECSGYSCHPFHFVFWTWIGLYLIFLSCNNLGYVRIPFHPFFVIVLLYNFFSIGNWILIRTWRVKLLVIYFL